ECSLHLVALEVIEGFNAEFFNRRLVDQIPFDGAGLDDGADNLGALFVGRTIRVMQGDCAVDPEVHDAQSNGLVEYGSVERSDFWYVISQLYEHLAIYLRVEPACIPG